MAKEICVFCGNEVGSMRGEYISCGPIYQWACKNCAREVKPLGETDRARRILQRRFTSQTTVLGEYVAMVDGAEEARPTCLRCGEKIYFTPGMTLDCSPFGDGILNKTYDVIPAVCRACGKTEFYIPDYIRKNKLYSYLVKKDTGEIK